MTVDQQHACQQAQFWLDCARNEVDPILKETCTKRAIKALMIASHGR